MSTFDSLVADLTHDAHRVQPKDALQFCANWFQSRLEEQRTRTRDALARRTSLPLSGLPADHYADSPLTPQDLASVSPFSPPFRAPYVHRPSVPAAPGPFGTLNVPGNALLAHAHAPPTFALDGGALSPTTPGGGFSPASPGGAQSPGGFLHPPSATILARRTSVSAESIAVDGGAGDPPPPVFAKTPEQLRRIRTSIARNFIFRDLDDEQEAGVLGAMQEVTVPAGEVVIRQGDVGEYFYVVEGGLLHCFIRADPPPPPALAAAAAPAAPAAGDAGALDAPAPADTFVPPGYHPDFGRRVAECPPGTSFGELALMYGHPRAATVLAVAPSTLWRLDRITFRTIILTAAHRRRTMYERFLAGVPLLASLEPEERSKIADALASRVYADGEDVVRQGEMGDTFFFVEEGEALVTKRQKDGDVREINRLTKGEYFGELSLMTRAPRAATVSAVRRTDGAAPKLKVAALDAAAFTRLLGPLREIMERKAGESYGPGYGLAHRMSR